MTSEIGEQVSNKLSEGKGQVKVSECVEEGLAMDRVIGLADVGLKNGIGLNGAFVVSQQRVKELHNVSAGSFSAKGMLVGWEDITDGLEKVARLKLCEGTVEHRGDSEGVHGKRVAGKSSLVLGQQGEVRLVPGVRDALLVKAECP